MIVVSDTTPVISLMKIGKLNLLERLFGEIRIPKAVYEELVSSSRFDAEAGQIRGSRFIRKIIVEDVRAVDLLRRATGLDLGESEAIILPDSNKAYQCRLFQQLLEAIRE